MSKRIYLLAQLDRRSHEALAGLYDQLARAGLVGEQTKGIPYHFTIGDFDTACEAEVLRRAQAVCAATPAFGIGISHLGLFGLRVLFAAPSVNGPLLRLRQALVPDACIDGAHNWVAHATLLIDTPESIRAAVEVAAQAFAPFVATVESIGVYEFFPKRLLAEYPLGG